MSETGDAAHRHLHEAVRVDPAELRMRAGAFVAMAAAFALVVGPLIAGTWLAAVIGLTLLGPRLLDGAAGASLSAQARDRRAIAYLVATYTVMGSLALIATLRGGLWGLVNGEFLLFSLLLYANTSARKSRTAFFAALAPLAAYLLAQAALGLRLEREVGGATCLAVGTIFLLVNSAAVHRRARTAALAVEEARDRAEAATAAKSAFVAMVSHELRTPISGILAGASELHRTAGDAATRDKADLIADAGQMMRSLLNDLLDLSKLEAGRMSVEQVPFDIRKTVRDTVRFWRPETRKRGLAFRLQGGHDLPELAVGDPTRIRQILNNLLSNALKFTDQGMITLKVSVTAGEGDAFALAIEVVDTGPGMSAEQLSRLFQPFEQLGPGTARTHGGTGLGLSISRELARLMGGELGAVSAAGEGASFRLELPMTRAHTIVRRKRRAAAPPVRRPLRALIVDDHAINRAAFGLILGAADLEADEAADGVEALEALAKAAYDVVLMDVNMPRMGGLDAVRALRAADGPNRGVIVIALTGASSPAEIDGCLKAGMDAYLMKPVLPGDLLAAIDEALNARQLRIRGAA